jgi:hypothetical protein
MADPASASMAGTPSVKDYFFKTLVAELRDLFAFISNLPVHSKNKDSKNLSLV